VNRLAARIRYEGRPKDRHEAASTLSEQSDSCEATTDNQRNGFRDHTSSRVTAMIAPLGQHWNGDISRVAGCSTSPDAPSQGILRELRSPSL